MVSGHELMLYAGVLLVLIVSSAFFSSAETAFMRTNRVRVRHQAEEGDQQAKRIYKIIKEPDRLLSTLLLGNNFVNVFASSLATALMIGFFGDEGVIYASISMTIIILIFGEIIPKSLAAYRPDENARWMSGPMQVIIPVLSPIEKMLSLLSRNIARLAGVDIGKADCFTEADIGSAIFLGHKDGFIKEPKARMMLALMDVDTVPVRKAMIPIHEVQAVDIEADFDQVVKIALRENYSRYPVYEGAHDNIVGYFHTRDTWQYLHKPAEFSLTCCLREAHFIPETKSLLKQLLDFQQMHNHMSFVVDEYGTVKGMITMEDIIEEITGDIADEHDSVPPTVVPVGPKNYLVPGGIGLRDLGRALGHEFPEEVDTLSGLIYAELDRIPEEGETVTWQDLRLRIERMRGNRITRVRITVE